MNEKEKALEVRVQELEEKSKCLPGIDLRINPEKMAEAICQSRDPSGKGQVYFVNKFLKEAE